MSGASFPLGASPLRDHFMPLRDADAANGQGHERQALSSTRLVDPHRGPASWTRIVDPHRGPTSRTRIADPLNLAEHISPRVAPRSVALPVRALAIQAAGEAWGAAPEIRPRNPGSC